METFGFQLFDLWVWKEAAMPTLNREKTKYPGVFYVDATSPTTGKPERIFYIRYRKDGKQVEEKAGRQYADDMTPAKAAGMRARRVHRDEPTNKEKREIERAQKEAEAGKWTIERLWEEYKERGSLKGLTTDENRFKNHIKPAFGSKEPVEIAPLDVDRLRMKLLKKKKPGTVRNVLELLRRIINFGMKKNLCEGPGFKIELPNANNLRTEDLSADQLKKLLKAIEKDSNLQAANLMKMVLFTGMRRSELFRLKWSDIDYDRGFINIRDPKGGRDQKVPLNDAARDLLSSHPKMKSPYVFPGRKGAQRKDIHHQVNRIKRNAGLPEDFRALHGLRHVYASMLASSGEVDMYTLQKLLTHKSPYMTQRYAHLRDEALKKASGLAGDLISIATKEEEKGEEEKVVNLSDHKQE